MKMFEELSPVEKRRVTDCIFALAYLGEMLVKAKAPIATNTIFLNIYQACKKAIESKWPEDRLAIDKQKFVEVFELREDDIPKLIEIWNYFGGAWIDAVDPERKDTTLHEFDLNGELVTYVSAGGG